MEKVKEYTAGSGFIAILIGSTGEIIPLIVTGLLVIGLAVLLEIEGF